MPTLEEWSALTERVAILEAENRSVARDNRGLAGENRALRRENEFLKRRLFGRESAERVSEEQLQLALAELEAEQAAQEAAEREVAGHVRREAKGPRRSTLADLPEDVETVVEEIVPDEVRAEPDAYERVDEERTEEIDILPMRVVRRVTVRPKFVRKAAVDRAPVIAPLPPRCVPGGIASAGLVAHLIVWKYVDHLPLYRIERILLRRFGIRIARQRLCDWIGYAAENWLSIIYTSIRNGLIGGDYLQIDETPIRYLDTERRGKCAQGYLWAFGRPEGDICFDWRLGRGKAGAEAILAEFRGVAQADGYAVYDSACAGRDIVLIGCWAHARRRFYEAYRAGELEAARYLLPVRELYAVEAGLPDDPAARAQIRKARSLPILERIRALLDAEADRYMAKSAMAGAVAYARSQWAKLTAYVDLGQARIDNNLTEQAIRPCKLGAKNWLFVGHPAAGKRTAILYTILETCRRRGVEPLAYLTDVLQRLPAMTNREAEELTPARSKAAQEIADQE